MEHLIQLPILYKGKEIELAGKWMSLGYTTRFVVTIEGQEIVFERDEDRNFRAMHAPSETLPTSIDPQLLEAVIATLHIISP